MPYVPASDMEGKRRECAALWLDQLLARLPRLELTLLIGQYAQRHFLGSRRKPSLAETAKARREYAPRFIPLPTRRPAISLVQAPRVKIR